MVGIETSDDAAVYKVSDDVAVIETVDFFTPIVDDPYTFGQIAAANALSDVYAMGGEPKIALNIVCFPNCLDMGILGEILRGGADKAKEAGVTLVGGHSVQDDEPKYGLCVTGFVHPDKVLRNCGCKEGDVLILTKQIGSGLINTALKGEVAEEEEIEEAITVMKSLNKTAAEVLAKYPLNACTDITGFGLLGHSIEMAEGSGVSFDIYTEKIPYINGALEYARMGFVPAGTYNNRNYSFDKVDSGEVATEYVDLLYDPQTSGGLLVSVPEECADDIMKDFAASNIDTKVSVIGKVRKLEDRYIFLH